MRVRLVSSAWLLVLVIAGTVTLSLLPGQEAKPPAATGPVVAPGRTPLAVTLPPGPARTTVTQPAASLRPGIDLAKLAPLHRQMYLSARHAADWLFWMNDGKGRFRHGLVPSLGVAL